MRLETITTYQIPREEDGRVSREFDHLFHRLRGWWPEVDVPAEWANPRRNGEHIGLGAIHSLRDGNAITQRQLDGAIDYLQRVVAFYENGPWGGIEPYPGRDEQAVRDHQAMLDELVESGGSVVSS